MKTVILSSSDGLKEAAMILKRGGIIIYPTETSYAIGADWTNPRATRKIFKVKGRNEQKKLPVIVPSLAAIKKYSMISKETKKLARAFMPGPLTLVVKRKCSSGTVAFRIPENDFALRLVKALGNPVTATSANLAGKPSVYDAREAMALFSGRVDAIVDAGKLRKRKASTIYDVAKRTVLREGPISKNNIKKSLKN